MTKHSYFPYTITYSSTRLNTNRIHNIHHTPYTNMQHTPTLQGQKTIFNNGRYTTNIPTNPHTVTTTDIKTNMRHTHTPIVSRHLSTKGNKKYCAHLHHTLSALYFPVSLVAPMHNSEQINHPSSKYSHPSPLCPLCNIHTSDTHHLFNCTHIRTTLSPLYLWTYPA